MRKIRFGLYVRTYARRFENSTVYKFMHIYYGRGQINFDEADEKFHTVFVCEE